MFKDQHRTQHFAKIEGLNIPKERLVKKSKSWILAIIVGLISLAFCGVTVELLLKNPKDISYMFFFPMVAGVFGLFVSGHIASQERFKMAMGYSIAFLKDIIETIKSVKS